MNPLQAYFNSATGKGIWKWEHYFDVYHRHLQKFIGSAPHIAEVGVFAGGSLEMWRDYFGADSTIHGVDRDSRCSRHEQERIHIQIGDQADRSFWQRFKQQVPVLHALIDDGGHQHEQQIATLEEIFPHLQPRGVYICEDITSASNKFSSYMRGIESSLNSANFTANSQIEPTALQQSIASIHAYPFIVVIEKHSHSPREFRAPHRGDTW